MLERYRCTRARTVKRQQAEPNILPTLDTMITFLIVLLPLLVMTVTFALLLRMARTEHGLKRLQRHTTRMFGASAALMVLVIALASPRLFRDGLDTPYVVLTVSALVVLVGTSAAAVHLHRTSSKDAVPTGSDS